MQGDVTGIYDATGDLVAQYAYDAWGNLIYSDNTDIANLNPIRYRGYYYDDETGFYYLQTRYYDPEIGRFISPDAYLSTGQGILGYNMYAYCLNNPVNYYDPTGTIAGILGSLAKVFVDALVVIAFAVLITVAVEYVVANPPDFPAFSTPPFQDDFSSTTTDELPKATVSPETKAISRELIESKTIDRNSKKDNSIIFPINPLDFHPMGLERVEKPGSKNGKFYYWKDPSTNTVIFRWDENPNFDNGPHYHVLPFSLEHYYGGKDAVPEPYDTIYFPR